MKFQKIYNNNEWKSCAADVASATLTLQNDDLKKYEANMKTNMSRKNKQQRVSICIYHQRPFK